MKTMLVLGVLCLTLENPTEIPAAGLWRSPLYTVGALLLAHMNLSIPVPALFFSGLDLALVFLAVIWVVRRTTASELDMSGRFPAAPPLRTAALLCIASIFFVCRSNRKTFETPVKYDVP